MYTMATRTRRGLGRRLGWEGAWAGVGGIVPDPLGPGLSMGEQVRGSAGCGPLLFQWAATFIAATTHALLGVVVELQCSACA